MIVLILLIGLIPATVISQTLDRVFTRCVPLRVMCRILPPQSRPSIMRW